MSAMSNPTDRARPDLGHALRTSLLGVASVTALIVLTACGGGGSSDADDNGKAKDDGVASINDPSGSGASAKATADADSGRPQLRLDTSDEESARLWGVWGACLHDKGVPSGKKSGSDKWMPNTTPDKYPAQYKACQSKQPLQPPETEPDTNPHYVDDYRAYVKCLNDHGIKVHMIPDHSMGTDALAWTFNKDYVQTMSEAESGKIDEKCEREAFSGDK
ncbi:hypothetical protein ACI2L1_34650 [Streptomyces sp. NPDC019531]|uniref:hypothetical protein n=1 Tax=Streptomyces sp. NPDC019531 TaxID=3365062 RepID=UPI00384CD607